MYTEDEKKTLSKAVIKLLRRFAIEIKLDGARTASSLLKLRTFTDIAFNNHEKCKQLIVLIKSDMWEMFGRELKNERS